MEMMGELVYLSLMKLYNLVILIVSLFYPKAKQWIKGRRQLFHYIESQLTGDNGARVWFHCSSLGEFEQARPLIEAFKARYPHYKIILTFFSPSGYEVKKNSKIADWVFYLPLDTPSNAKRLVRLFKPKLVFFVKYDFWYFILKELHKAGIPTILFSALFRENQLFFKRIGKWYRQVLHFFSHIFVLDDESKQLLERYGINSVSVVGDTRFDRVYKIAKEVVSYPCIERFVAGAKVIVAGSTYEPDEELLSNFISYRKDVKLIVVPHEVDERSIERVLTIFSDNYYRYSYLRDSNRKPSEYSKQVMIIDTIGLLSRLYRYGDVAYVGGGFGKGIHNILEAIIYGIPVVFGPNYQKFKEAIELSELKVAYPIEKREEFFEVMNRLLDDRQLKEEISTKIKDYVSKKLGATEKILLWIEKNIPL